MTYAYAERLLDWEGGRVWARTAGRGLPVVLLHSLGGASTHWRLTEPALLAAGFSVTSIDLPGHGRSALPTAPFSPLSMGRDLAAGLDRPSVLVGNSLGGWVALRAYLERPEAVLGIALVASAGLVGMPTRPPKLPFGPGRSNLIETLLSSVFHDPAAVASEAREALIAGAFAPGLLTLNPEGALASTDLARIRCPVSVLWGREDRILPVCWADRFADALPLVKRRVIDQCGHLPQLEKPGVFNPELVAFCRVFA